MRFRGSLAARVALLATVAVGLSVALGSAAAYALVRHQLVAALDRSLVERGELAVKGESFEAMTGENIGPLLLLAEDLRLMLIRADGFVLDVWPRDGSMMRPSRDEVAVAAGGRDGSARTAYVGGEAFRVVAVGGPQRGTALVLAQSLNQTHETLSRLGFLLAVFGLLGVCGAAVAGWLVGRNGVSPVRRLSAAVEGITRTQRLEPIPVEGEDEVATLAATFNRMLAALDASQSRQRQLVADAGHELRTPLTALRTNIDLLRQAEGRGGLAPEARTELLDDVRFQIDELTTLIGDLTELARDDPAPAQLEPLDLADVAARALDRVRRRATHVRFDSHLEPWPVTGEGAALERAVTNLLDNAAKWSPADGLVTVRLADGVLSVTDQGPGIAEADLPHVFERFYRSTEARTLPGSGLGLSIVRAVAERHGGMVSAGHAAEGGAAFWLWIPGSVPPRSGATALSHPV